MGDTKELVIDSRKNKVLLVSVVFGALFIVGLIIFGVSTVRYFAENFTVFNSVYTAAGGSKYGFQDAMRDLFSRELELSEIEISVFNNVQLRYHRYYLMEELRNSLLIALLIVIAIPALITNILGWLKNSGRLTLVSGILNFFSLNWVSANLCLVEYFDARKKITNKFFLYIAVFSLSFVLIWIIFWTYILGTDSLYRIYGSILYKFIFFVQIEFYVSLIQFVVYSSIIMSAGVALNFVAWKKDTVILRRLVFVFYMLGGFTVISAIACFVYYWRYNKTALINEKKNIKTKFFLCTAAVIPGLLFLALLFWIAYPFLTARTDGSSVRTGDYYTFLCFIIIISVGVILHFAAWKKNDQKLKLLACGFYLLGLFISIPSWGFMIIIPLEVLTLIPAIVCFVYPGKNQTEEEEKETKNIPLLCTAVASLVFVLAWIALLISIPGANSGSDNSVIGFTVYSFITMGTGVALNFVAWKKNSRILKKWAGVLYLLGVLTVISAIICFVYAGKDKKKVEEKGIIPEKAAE